MLCLAADLEGVQGIEYARGVFEKARHDAEKSADDGLDNALIEGLAASPTGRVAVHSLRIGHGHGGRCSRAHVQGQGVFASAERRGVRGRDLHIISRTGADAGNRCREGGAILAGPGNHGELRLVAVVDSHCGSQQTQAAALHVHG